MKTFLGETLHFESNIYQTLHISVLQNTDCSTQTFNTEARKMQFAFNFEYENQLLHIQFYGFGIVHAG